METPKVLPKGTTQEQWDQYQEDLARHNAYYEDIMPQRHFFETEEEYNSAMSEWNMNSHCFEPNHPGYYIANND